MMNTEKYRVYNKCNFDIGATLANGTNVRIKPDGFVLMDADDIAHVESICVEDKFFSKRMLVPYNKDGKPLDFENIGLSIEKSETTHLSNAEIEALLKGPVKKLEAWLDATEDPAEIGAIVSVAKEMDVSSSRLKLIQAKAPNADLLSK